MAGAVVLISIGFLYYTLDRQERLHVLERKSNADGTYDAISYAHEYSPIDAPYYEVAIVPHGQDLDKNSWVLKLGHEDVSPFAPGLQLTWLSTRKLLLTYKQGRIGLVRHSLRPGGFPWSEELEIEVRRR